MQGGVQRRLIQSEDLGLVVKPTSSNNSICGGKGEQKRGVYSDGPRSVYQKLNKSPISKGKVLLSKQSIIPNKNSILRINPLPANMRKQNQIVKDLNLRVPLPSPSCSVAVSSSSIKGSSRRSVPREEGVTRNSPSRGDFNSITKVGERRGSNGAGCQSERVEFAQFIDAFEVVDIPLMGKKFTWFNSDGTVMSRLDRFLLSEGFMEKGNISNQWVDFFAFVKEKWDNMDIRGRKAFVIKEKLKKLKEYLKEWNREVFGFLDLKIDNTVKELNEVEELLANGTNVPNSINPNELVKQFWDQIQFKESILHQKSRTKWIQEGDSNTRFFHASIKSRHRRNQIANLKKGDVLIQGVAEIKEEVKDHFFRHFTEEWHSRPFLQGIDFNTLSSEDNSFLLEPFGEEEVRDTVWSCDGNKSPGPDGFNLNFLKACWPIVKEDVMAFVLEFQENACLPKAVTASFLTLIPKKDHPQNLFDYRPICLIGCLYKILSKLLANRLKKVLGKLISKCQSAFLPHRQILDGVVVLNEIIDLAKRRKDGCLLFKVDFERAYDTVSWSYLERMMFKMGFSDGWITWLRTCIFQSSMSILVNGSPTADFNVGRGLRQGDPLSPFLFLIVAEGLAGLMRKAVELGKFKGYSINDDIQFQILQFADDTILMGEGTWDNIRTIKILLRSFELVSGLKINFVKSKLYGLNVDTRLLKAGSSFLSCRSEVIPFKFLGIPVGANPRRRETWKPVVDAMNKRLNTWSCRLLSYGGRITLINSVLASLPLYYFSFFKAPCCILKQLVRIQRNFLWGGGEMDKKLCWVKWEQICLSKEKGGLGVKNLDLFNQALLSKWKWRFLSDDNALWTDLLRIRYGHLPTQILGRDMSLGDNKSSIWWRDIIGLGKGREPYCFNSNIRSCVGNGFNIGFWNFKWFGNHTFRDLFPVLFAKEATQEAMVAERLFGNGRERIWSWQWTTPLSVCETRMLDDLKVLLADFSLQANVQDTWRWVPGNTGFFSVKSCYNWLLEQCQIEELSSNVLIAIKKLWRNDVPSKVNFFGWRLLLERLPTRMALHHRGILNNVHELSCVFCFLDNEDCNHLFFLCPFSKRIWEAIFKWIGKRFPPNNKGWNHFVLFGDMVKSKKGERVRHLIWLATSWNIWKLRNSVIFKGALPNALLLLDDIKFSSWVWFSSRYGRNSSLSFQEWCHDPLGCIQSF
ncbi:unnamed protein product [Trifolium pratense]|uniref:Uncharacterized protein n=1 Tax=Trifolium pratense TaxID=57577 RepID=A0ACB0J035_TRIPR|nr:unnamed protein product [Trifolium pratense]